MAGGQSDNDKRQPLWSNGGYNTQSELYVFMKAVVGARKQMIGVGDDTNFDVLVADDGARVFAFVRGSTVVVTSISGGGGEQTANIAASRLPSPMQPDGTKLCDTLSSGSTYVSNGNVAIKLENGLPGLYTKC